MKHLLLVIEDDPAMREMFALYSESVGTLQMTLAASLKQARAHLSQQEFDVVLADMNLTDSAGLDTIKEVVKMASDVPVFVFTGAFPESIKDAVKAAGAAGFFVKGESINFSLLFSYLEFAAEQTRRRRQTTGQLNRIINDLRAVAYGGKNG